MFSEVFLNWDLTSGPDFSLKRANFWWAIRTLFPELSAQSPRIRPIFAQFRRGSGTHRTEKLGGQTQIRHTPPPCVFMPRGCIKNSAAYFYLCRQFCTVVLFTEARIDMHLFICGRIFFIHSTTIKTYEMWNGMI